MQTPSTIVNMKATYNGCRSINIRHGDAKIPVRVYRDSIISPTKQVIILTNLVARSLPEINLDKY